MTRAIIQTTKLANEVFLPTHTEHGLPVRYRVLVGGRGGMKSWEVAQRLIDKTTREKKRILCTREIQKSIRDSVHRVLCDNIDRLGYQHNFDPGVNYLYSDIGSEFIYKGLRHNPQEIKSLEAIDICWIEEGQNTSKESLEILIPTIRKENSEIWITFNPYEVSDPVYDMFITNPRPDAIVRWFYYWDNPWLPEVLRREMEYMKRVDYESYLHVWEGRPLTSAEAQVLKGKWKVESFEPVTKADRSEEIWHGPYYGADWGFASDPTALVKMWIHKNILYIEYECYGVGVDIDKTPALFDKVPGAKEHVIQADSARPETISYMNRHGYPRIHSVKKWPGSVEDGVAFIRQFEQIIIHPRCRHAAEEARLWSYKKDRLTGDVLPELLDKNNHIWDSVRYGLVKLIRQRTTTQKPIKGLF